MFLSQTRRRLDLVQCSNPNTSNRSQPLKSAPCKKLLQLSTLQAEETNLLNPSRRAFPHSRAQDWAPQDAAPKNHKLCAARLVLQIAACGRDASQFNFRPHRVRGCFPPGHAPATPTAPRLPSARSDGPAGARVRGATWAAAAQFAVTPRRAGTRRLAQSLPTARRRARALPVPSPVTCLAEAAQGRCSY